MLCRNLLIGVAAFPFVEYNINRQSLSPIRYPGGKTRAINILYTYLPPNIKEICSPFFGGGSFEIWCAHNGIMVYGYDLFEPLVNFWKCLIEDPNELSLIVNSLYPLSKQKFYYLQSNYHTYGDKWYRAGVFFVLNRSSFNGSTLSGGMSPTHPRFTKKSIDKLRNFNVSNLSVGLADFTLSIAKHTDTFLYLDPPYKNNSRLYGRYGNMHSRFDHELLADMLRDRDGWLMSYNDCPEIRHLYSGFDIHTPSWAYGMSSKSQSNEILILSHH